MLIVVNKPLTWRCCSWSAANITRKGKRGEGEKGRRSFIFHSLLPRPSPFAECGEEAERCRRGLLPGWGAERPAPADAGADRGLFCRSLRGVDPRQPVG